MKRYSKYFLIFIPFCLITLNLFGQTKEELEQKRKEKQEEIRFTRKLIEQTSEKQKQTINHLKVLNQQIESREELINTIQQEIDALESSIQTNKGIIESLEEDLEELKKEYEKMMRFSYKTRSKYDKLVFIFSAESFNTAYKRLRFLRYYSDFRKRQIEMIRETRASLQGKVRELQSQREEKQNLLAKQRQEKQRLEENLEEKSKLVENLKEKEDELRQQLARKKERAEELERAIERLIEEEMKAKKEAGAKEYANTPEARIVSEKFRNNKAHLPWPVDQGFISQEFGRQPHPTLRGVYVNNSGIQITTSKDAKARAVFDGEVRRIVDQRGAGLAVLVRHGKYFTVYSNLEEAKVEPGESVETNEVIGIVKTNEESGNAELNFQVWHSFDKLNPANWLARK